MSSDLAISSHGLSKDYLMGLGGRTTPLHQLVKGYVRHPVTYRGGRRKRHVALDDVTFDVHRGEALAIIGRNGAGKSTLLKILSRITLPTRGTARLNGLVGSLLEVGTGFHPELTGRENVFLNGAILGMRKQDITARFDEIVEFSGVTEYLDTPVKRYSSGMRVRLAFAVAAHLEPEIMIIDEVLAVGDAAFQRRCLDKMRQVADEDGRTVLFVSHNLASVQFLCDRSIYLESGKIVFDGETHEAIEIYLGRAAVDHPEASDVGVFDLARATRHHDARLPVFQQAKVLAGEGRTTDSVRAGGRLDLRMSLSHLDECPNPSIILRIMNDQDQLLCRMSTAMRPLPDDGLPHPADRELVVAVPSLPLLPGHYTIEALVRDGETNEVVDHVRAAADFNVLQSDFFGSGYIPQPKDGSFMLTWHWELRDDLPGAG